MEELNEKIAQSNCVSWENRILCLKSLRNVLGLEYENLGYDIWGLERLFETFNVWILKKISRLCRFFFFGELRLGLGFEREFCGLILGNVGWW